MKRLALAACVVVALLTACSPAEGGQASELSSISLPASEAVVTARIITGAAEGNLLLAGQNDEQSNVFRLSTADLTIADENGAAVTLKNGMLVEVGYNGTVMETFPAQLGTPTSLKVLHDTDNLPRIYLNVLNDLWETDVGLNSDITELGVDLSGTRLSKTEQAAVAWAFGEQHGLVPIQGTYNELLEQGYISEVPLESGNASAYVWENGCLFSIEEQANREGKVTFNAEKWRSGLGAYFFSDCTATQNADGTWNGYKVGSEAIS